MPAFLLLGRASRPPQHTTRRAADLDLGGPRYPSAPGAELPGPFAEFSLSPFTPFRAVLEWRTNGLRVTAPPDINKAKAAE
jgi:hypothetical protein